MDTPTYSECTRCLMRVEEDRHIKFDKYGMCSYCLLYDKVIAKKKADISITGRSLNELVNEIKKTANHAGFDCVIGVSGGIDSTYTVYKAVEFGLKPLLINLDNGWDSPLAVSNINKLSRKLGLQLEKYVIDKKEFTDLQLAYLRASVVDIEAPTDHAIGATLLKTAVKHNIKYIISGDNYATEGVMPPLWVHSKSDARNISSIHKKYGHLPLVSFPLMSQRERQKLIKSEGIKYVMLLDYLDYNKKEAINKMQAELDWEDYKEKHFESIFTRFYQSYILPRKFNADKRRVHLSVLVQGGQMTREEALLQLSKPPLDEAALQQDKAFVLKNLELTEQEFEDLMQQPPRSHFEFDVENRWLHYLSIIKRRFFN